MIRPSGARAAALVLAALACASAAAHGQALPQSSLAVDRDGAWHEWWRAEQAPARWRASLPALAGAAVWRSVRPGLDTAELDIAGDGTAWRLSVVLVRLDPRSVRLRLDGADRDAGTRGAWSLATAPTDAVLALNAGQFSGGRPWGWVVRDGHELQPPGTGPLSMGLVVDTAGGVRLVPVDSIDALRGDAGVAEAFQSYPALLRGDGSVPPELMGADRGVDVTHRDSRLAIGQLRDGRILIALTRFAGLGAAGAGLPFGPTTPEMAALMGALGCRTAVLLDGGLSAQMAVTDDAGRTHEWKGWRRVPLALVAFPRDAEAVMALARDSTHSPGNDR